MVADGCQSTQRRSGPESSQARRITFALRLTAYGQRPYITLGTPDEGWTESKAQTELQNVLADVRRGTWRRDVLAPPPETEQTFHEFASAWFRATEGEWRESTRLAYWSELVNHLLPFFQNHLLSQITVAEVDRYRQSKLDENKAIEARTARCKGKPRTVEYEDERGRRCKRPERPLSATSINKTITRLGQVLEVATERELIPRNPVKVGGKRRKVKPVTPRRAYLDRAAQITALLDAAGRIDRRSQSGQQLPRRAMLATMVFAGLRISELLDLRWRDIDLAAGRLHVRRSKTDAGVREVHLLPVLRDELIAHKASRPSIAPEGLVFPSAVQRRQDGTQVGGTRQDRNRVRGRVLAGAVVEANKQLAADDLAELPEGLTLHALRRTFASILIALPRDPAHVMAQMGHTSPTMTLGLYAKAMESSEEDRARLRRLVEGVREGDYLAVAGSSSAAERAAAAK